jgi:hypothetical protein
MNEAFLEKKLTGLLEELLLLLPVQESGTVGRTSGNFPPPGTPRARQSLGDAMDCLRVGVKYLLFDMEATRRENIILRRQLEDEM